MKKITIIALHLGYGGIEKCIANTANSLCEDYNINIVSVYKLYDKPPFKLNRKIKITYLMNDDTALKVDLYKKLFRKLKFIKLCKALYNDYLKKLNFKGLFKDTLNSIKITINRKKLITNYISKCDSDIIITTRYEHNKLLGKYGSKKALKVGWEHNHHNNDNKYIIKVINSVKHLDYFVLVSKSLKEFYQENLTKTKCKCVYIPNGLDEIPDNKSKLDKKNIISIGRLSPEKGFVDLIDVFNIVHQTHPDWHLNIVGDGILYNEINTKIKEYQLEDAVTLHGFQKKDYIDKLLLESSIYVMTSYTESFGLVLIEAMSYGIPCLSFDSARGSLEVIDNNINGFIIKNRNVKRMVNKINDLIEDKNLRRLLGKEALKKSLKFGPERIKHDWIKLIEQEANHGKNK